MDGVGLSMNTVDALTSLPHGYVGKVLGPARVRTVGLMRFFELAETLALRVEIEPDPDSAWPIDGKSGTSSSAGREITTAGSARSDARGRRGKWV